MEEHLPKVLAKPLDKPQLLFEKPRNADAVGLEVDVEVGVAVVALVEVDVVVALVEVGVVGLVEAAVLGAFLVADLVDSDVERVNLRCML